MQGQPDRFHLFLLFPPDSVTASDYVTVRTLRGRGHGLCVERPSFGPARVTAGFRSMLGCIHLLQRLRPRSQSRLNP